MLFKKENLKKIQEYLKKSNLKAYLIFTSDPHDNEYIAPFYLDLRKFFAPFSGSAAELLITQNEAYLFTDGRYYLQAEKELKGSDVYLIKKGDKNVPSLKEFILKNNLFPLGSNLYTFKMSEYEDFIASNIKIVDLDISFLINNLTPLSKEKVFKLDESLFTFSYKEKIEKIYQKLNEKNAKATLITTLDDIAYILNLRGRDIPFNPVFYSYLYLSKDYGNHLFIDKEKINFEIEGINIHPYENIEEFIKKHNDIPTLLDKGRVNAKIYQLFNNVIDGINPSYLMKAVKNEKEILNTKEIQALDGVALLKFNKFLDENISNNLTEYQYSENGVPQQMDAPVAQYDFEDLSTGDVEKLDGWYVSATGDLWEAKEYNKNKYLQFTANYADGVAEAWLVTPAIKIEDAEKQLAWDVCVGYWNADCLEVYILENFDGKDLATASKTNVTANFSIPQEPTNKYGTMASAGAMSLAAYSGKTINVAYHYLGDKNNKKTTTYQIDNIVIGNDIPTPVNTELRFALYEKTSKGWYVFSNTGKALSVPYDAYADMGDAAEDKSFSSSVKAENYIPNYLLKNIEYPLNGDTCTVIYRYYAGSGNYKAYSDQYVYNDTVNVWKYTDNVYVETRPYGFDGSEWVYSPSVTIDLPVQKGNAEVAAFYQAITDWVKENHPEYVTGYGNNDYYYGGSAYQNNFDFRVSAWKGQGTYNDMSDADIENLMWERLPEAFPHALEKLYADAAPAESGVPVIYTINFGIYDGSSTTTWTIQYEVVSKGKFEYVKDSLKQAE